MSEQKINGSSRSRSRSRRGSRDHGKAMQKQKNKSKVKNRDINRRGAEKEGTDMDAFVNTTPPAKIETASESASMKQQQHANKDISVQKDNKQELPGVKELTKDIKEKDNHESKKEKENMQIEKIASPELPKEESVPTSLEKTQLPTINSNKESALTNEENAKALVCNILPNKTDDVVDHAKSSSIKTDHVDLKAIVAQKNEENSKVSALRPTPTLMTTPVAETTETTPLEEKKPLENETPAANEPATPKPAPTKPVLRYKYSEDQWSPINQTGKKVYSRDFLMELQYDPHSRVKPGNLSDMEAILKNLLQNRSPVEQKSFGGNSNIMGSLLPGFAKTSVSGSKTMPSSKKSYLKPNKSSKPALIQVTLSLREEVKLRETENAWKPVRLKATPTSEEEEKTEKLYKKVRSVLNKLTPEKFNKLVNQVRSLEIDSQERLEGVINLVFLKAIDEPNFSEAYALMCKELSNMQVTSTVSQETNSTNFRKLIITRCQTMFEKHNSEENTMTLELHKKIEGCKDPEKKKELQVALEEEKRLIRMKSVGNIRFIGELFKQGMLTTKIMHECIRHLLKNQNEENLECLCKLLTTIGKLFETKSDLTDYFKHMEQIASGKGSGKISSRIRFMLQDVIDLRKNNWRPRRDDSNPKTIGEIQKEVESERMIQGGFNNPPVNTPRKDDRGADRKRNRGGVGPIEDGGWSQPIGRTRQPYSVETAKLKNKPPSMDDLQLGNRNTYLWANKNVPTNNSKPLSSVNKFTVLDSIPAEQEKRIPPIQFTGSRSTGPREFRSEYGKSNYDRSNTRNGSHQMNSGSSSRESSVLDSTRSQSLSMPPPSMKSASQSSSTSASKSESSKDLGNTAHDIIEQFISNLDTEKAKSDIKESFDSSNLTIFVRETINSILEKTSSIREKVSELLCNLLTPDCISLTHFKTGFAEVLETADDLVIDVPKIWMYFAEILYHPVQRGILPLSEMKSLLKPLWEQGHAGKMMGELLAKLTQAKSSKWVQEKWSQSGLYWNEIADVNKEDINEIIASYKLEFLKDDNKAVYSSSEKLLDNLNCIHDQLLTFMKENNYDDISSWITMKVGDKVKEPQFIRVLMTAILESSIETHNDRYDFKEDTFSHLQTLIQRFVDANGSLELQCLFAIQLYMHKLKHPPGLILKIFNKLFDDNILSTEAFLAWESNKDPAEQEGKGVTVKASTSFFTALKEAEASSDEEVTDASKDKDPTTTGSNVQSVSQSSSVSQDCRG